MRIPLVLVLACATTLQAQRSLPVSLNPDAADLNGGSFLPLMAASCRVQQFYEAGEVGTATLLASRLLLRYDAASSGPATTHTIQKLTLRFGATARGVASLGAVFGQNLTQPLTTAYQAASYSYQSDGVPTAGPKPFGGPGGRLLFVLPAPTSVAVPAGGAFALEILIDGNSNSGQAGAQLDFHVDPSAAQNLGQVTTNGRGCASGPAAANSTLETLGSYQPGTPLTLYGADYPPNVPIALMLTAQTLLAPFGLPGTTPICWIYLDTAAGLVVPMGSSDATGALVAFGGDPLPIPKSPGMCGAVLYVQNAAPTPQWSGNGFGVLTSNYRTIVLGCPTPPQVGAWMAGNHTSSSAAVATVALNGALAFRLE